MNRLFQILTFTLIAIFPIAAQNLSEYSNLVALTDTTAVDIAAEYSNIMALTDTTAVDIAAEYSNLVTLTDTTAVDIAAEYLNLVELADSAIAQSDWQDAEQIINEAMNLDPQNPGNILLMSNLGIVRFNQGKDKAAIEALDKAHDMAPASVTVLTNRARVHAAIGNMAEAYRDFDMVMQLDSTLWEPVFYHGMLAMNMGDVATAQNDFTRLETMAPNEESTHLALASLHVAKGEKQEAIKQFNWLIDNHLSASYLLERAILRMQLNDLNEASADIQDALNLEPDNGEIYLYRALLNKMRYRIEDANKDARRAEELGIPADFIKQLIN